MLDSLRGFISSVKDFDGLAASGKVDVFALFLEDVERKEYFTSNDIDKCFKALRIAPYSNISAYLTSRSKRGKLRFIKNKTGYHLEGLYKKELLKLIGIPKEPEPSNALFPLSLFDATRGYLIKVARQATICYDQGQYDASFVMIRKLLEILIIECYERKSIQSAIKNSNGDYFYLSDLINHFTNSTEWHITRNAKTALPRIKHLADQSAHNRKFIAQKVDIDKIKDDLRTCLGEVLNTIDYPHWK